LTKICGRFRPIACRAPPCEGMGSYIQRIIPIRW
jgi:hypothetical protein